MQGQWAKQGTVQRLGGIFCILKVGPATAEDPQSTEQGVPLLAKRGGSETSLCPDIRCHRRDTLGVVMGTAAENSGGTVNQGCFGGYKKDLKEGPLGGAPKDPKGGA